MVSSVDTLIPWGICTHYYNHVKAGLVYSYVLNGEKAFTGQCESFTVTLEIGVSSCSITRATFRVAVR